MTNLKNIRINENEAQRVLDLLNTKLVQKITIGKLLVKDMLSRG